MFKRARFSPFFFIFTKPFWANYLTELAPRLKTLGIDAVWIPPTIKNTGTNSVGYAPFDHYDLGDKWQKGNVKTRMGDKDELLRMMAVFKANGIDVIQDVVLNHVVGAGTKTSVILVLQRQGIMKLR